MEKIKSFFSTVGGYIVAALGVVVAVLGYLYVRKQEENQALQARLMLANTQKDVDIIEAQIKETAAARELSKKEQAALDSDLALVEQKRAAITASKTDQQIEEYWNK